MEDSKIYFLQPGYILASCEHHLIHIVLGSCVAVCLWDSKSNFGGACHFIYPHLEQQEANGKFGEVAVPHLIGLMEELSSTTSDLRAHIVGGGTKSQAAVSSIGNENAAIAEAILKKCHIKIVTKEVGGSIGRKVIYDTMSGKILVYQTDDIRQNDWYE